MVKLYLVLGIVWVIVGLRDLLAPGFLAQRGRTVGAWHIALSFSIGIFWLIIAWAIVKGRKS